MSQEKTLRHWEAAELAALNTRFHDRPPEELLEWGMRQFGRRMLLTCSFGGSAGMVLLDMLVRLGGRTPIIFLDTNLLFPETYTLVDQTVRRYGVKIARRQPLLTLEDQAAQQGPELWAREPDRCCAIRKVAPLAEALRPYDAWVSGIRRDQTTQRAATPLVEWNARHQLLKLSPLAGWSEKQVWAYILANDVPYNPLLDQGYTSIGCVPCTRPASAGRDGRWSGFAKVECGIHI